MRIRQVKPDFWTDEKMAALPDAVRLFYIGTWQLADDGGWFEWNVSEIGLHLYGYSPRSRRERWVQERGAALVDVGRLRIEVCGHAFVPNLAKHQRFGGKPVFTHRELHRQCRPPDSPTVPQSPPTPHHGRERVGKGNGMERKGIAGKTTFEDAVERASRKAAAV